MAWDAGWYINEYETNNVITSVFFELWGFGFQLTLLQFIRRIIGSGSGQTFAGVAQMMTRWPSQPLKVLCIISRTRTS